MRSKSALEKISINIHEYILIQKNQNLLRFGARLEQKKTPKGSLILFITYGALGTIRTCDLQIRSLMLYPAELRAHERQNRILV